MRLSTLFCILLLFAFTTALQATTYYVSPGGSDENSGTSRQQAWATPDKVSNSHFLPGDSVLFEGGSRFEGGLFFGPESRGTAEKPIVFSTYYSATHSSTGRVPALIYSGNESGFQVYNSAGFKIVNLRFEGSGRTINGSSGIDFYLDLPTTRLAYIHIDSVEVWGYREAGIKIGSWNGASGYDGIRITNTLAHDNGDVGITTYAEALLGHTDVYVGYSKVYNNAGLPDKTYSHSGSGIVLGGVDGGLIEYCEAYNNGWLNAWQGGGPVGIWAYRCNNLTIQYSESHHNKTGTAKDGGGFDIDGGCTNCTMQYNYSHDNEGPGYLIAQYAGAPPLKGVVIRYNISENDGRKNGYGGIHLWSSGANGGIQDAQIYNNTVYMTPSGTGTPRALYVQSGGVKGVKIWNNIFQTTGGLELVYVDRLTDLRFEGNNYWAGAGNFKINWGGTVHASLGNWRDKTGQERSNSGELGYSQDPRLKAPGGGITFGEPGQLYLLSGYELQKNSPMADKGLDLSARHGLDMGRQDFWGNSLQHRSSLSIGAHQPTNIIKACLQGGITPLATSSPEGGSYRGQGVLEGKYLDPQQLGAGQHPIQYVYTDTNGVEHKEAHSVRVLPGETTHWLGGQQGTTDWFDANNWSSCVPTLLIDATLPAAGTEKQPKISKGRAAQARNLQAAGQLALDQDAQLEIAGAYAGERLEAGRATVVFTGSEGQQIPAGSYGKLLLQGRGNRALAGSISVKKELALGAGKLLLGNHDLRLGEEGLIKHATASQYLVTNGQGSVVLEGIGGERNGFFPLGTAESYTPALVENKGETNAFSLRVEEGVWSAGTSGTPLLQEGVNRSWHLSEGQKGGAQVDLTLYWTAAEEQELFVRSRAYLSHYEGVAWSGPDAHAGFVEEAALEGFYSIQLRAISSFSPFAIFNRPIPLPVSLGGFGANAQGSDALLQWLTYSEKDNRGFGVEVSTDGRHFRSLGFVPSLQPTSSQQQHYTFLDREPGKEGVRYYRLRQEDLDGSTTYSELRMLRFGPDLGALRAYPNPFSDKLRLEVQAEGAEAVEVTMVDALGRTVYTGSQPLQAGTNRLDLNLQQLQQPGLYVLTARWGGRQQQLRIMKR
jgi:hypothetical protein